MSGPFDRLAVYGYPRHVSAQGLHSHGPRLTPPPFWLFGIHGGWRADRLARPFRRAAFRVHFRGRNVETGDHGMVQDASMLAMLVERSMGPDETWERPMPETRGVTPRQAVRKCDTRVECPLPSLLPAQRKCVTRTRPMKPLGIAGEASTCGYMFSYDRSYALSTLGLTHFRLQAARVTFSDGLKG